MEVPHGYATQNRLETSYRQVQEAENLKAMRINQLCTDLVAIKEKTLDPVTYVRYVVSSLFDNLDVDLCQLYYRNDRCHEDLTQRIGCLIGFDSNNFKTMLSSDELVEEFVDKFSRHAENSLADSHQAQASLYIWLLKAYLYHLLPVTQDAISYVKSLNWYRKNFLAQKKQKFTTPFRLLKDEVYSELARSYHESDLDDGNIYVRLFHFVELLLVNLTSLSITPSASQLVAVSVLIDYYMQFVLSDGQDKEVQSLKKKLKYNHQFAQVLVPFLKRNLVQSSIDSTFLLCFEILSNLLSPMPEIYQDEEKLKIFIEMSSFYFVDLLYIVVDKMKNANLEVLLNMNVLQIFTELFNNDFIRVLCALRVNATDFMEPIEEKLKSFVSMTSVVDLDESFSNRIHSIVHNWMPTEDESSKSRARLFLKTISDQLANPYCVYPPNKDREQRKTQDTTLNTTPAMNQAHNKTLERSIFYKSTVPDYVADPWTQMYHLTPKGIDQVLRREAQFDYTKYRYQLAAHSPSKWQFRPLYEYLSHVSVKWSRHPIVVYLKRLSKNEVLGPVASLALQPSSPIKGVPVYGKNLPRQPETINLRFLSYYPVMLIVLVILWKLFSAFLHVIYVL
ncbi:unnamed protein product [Bursaphelenchus okinawaensis]|uniref:Uncharacterized protein n=1 Tax=Bursaphelenchus okinawaensis TaxID=465554 RepID=A0A811JVF7_9BILA|nr:unnamed protein product [Bursaphelenchus okinawaensis]CAG9085715.1 unnamed protein product [Bursaphelenchus okinawaensis]